MLSDATGLAVPSLAGIPAMRSITLDSDGFRIARAMLNAGVANPDDWSRSEGNALRFIALTVERWAAEAGGIQLREDYGFTWTVTDRMDRLGYGSLDRAHDVLVALENEHAVRAVPFAGVFAELEEVHPQLPATFYELLRVTLRRVVNWYDWYDAAGRVEYEAEAAWEYEHEGEAVPDAWLEQHREQVIPGCLKRKGIGRRRTEKLMATLPRESRVLQLLERAAVAYAVARKLPVRSVPIAYDGSFDGPPAPALVFHGTENDEIVGYFDGEMEEWAQAGLTAAPSMLMPLSLKSVSSLRTARDRVMRATQVLVAFDNLADMIENHPRQRIRARGGRPLSETLVEIETDIDVNAVLVGIVV